MKIMPILKIMPNMKIMPIMKILPIMKIMPMMKIMPIPISNKNLNKGQWHADSGFRNNKLYMMKT